LLRTTFRSDWCSPTAPLSHSSRNRSLEASSSSKGPHPAIAGVSAVNPAEGGHERCLEDVDTARPADDPSLAVAQGRPGDV
jgi:hypothetical protein